MKKDSVEAEEKKAIELPAEPAKGKKPAKKPKKEKTVVSLEPKEIEERIVALANQGVSASEIGAILRDENGIPKLRVTLNKTVSQILKEHHLEPEIPEDLMALIRRVVALDKHLTQNKKDFSAKRGYQLTVSKIRRLVGYYHQNGRLPKKWRYSIETARLLVK